VNFSDPVVNGFRARRGFRASAPEPLSADPVRSSPMSLQVFDDLSHGKIILRFENLRFGCRVQPSGLRPHSAFSAFEFSHSLVNITQWLTANMRKHVAFLFARTVVYGAFAPVNGTRRRAISFVRGVGSDFGFALRIL
jgi:hypothetical protein